MTKDELHLHLHGCLTAEDVWQLSKDSWETRIPALEWYASEYEKAWGRRPQWETYWTQDDGFEILRKDYEFTRYADFAQFQACFNLVIALFPLSPDDVSVFEHVLVKYAKSYIEYAEFRTPFGMRFADNEDGIFYFLNQIASLVLDIEKKTSFQARFAISLPREDSLLEFQYRCLKDWLAKNKNLAPAIVGIDFCGFEESSSPETKRNFFGQVLKDNLSNPQTSLAILYHVGETFQNIDIETSIQWVRDAHVFGAHRLGHCTSLGIVPNSSYSQSRRDSIIKLQDDTMQELKIKGLIIESCPRSNIFIGGIRDFKSHPLSRFLKHGLNVVLSSDDPGIFDTSLRKEEEFARTVLELSDTDLSTMAKCARSSHSAILSGRV